uniref:Succinate:cytochrome c oxidoreductase subunit 3 n=1 Tax=Pyropia tanegashimensis TaxID=683350 RepID=H3JS66_9RHOD|nr:succinate:cytochrome c oxidoreductase subunit 3 [Phycocalidia tanegashimensis]
MSNVNRPLSPHLTIYNPQRSSIFSIWHRISGVIMFISVSSLAFLLNQAYFTYTTVSLMKFLFNCAAFNLLSFCYISLILTVFLYHITNGIRHFLWDSVIHVNSKKIHRDSNIILLFIFINIIFQFYIKF